MTFNLKKMNLTYGNIVQGFLGIFIIMFSELQIQFNVQIENANFLSAHLD